MGSFGGGPFFPPKLTLAAHGPMTKTLLLSSILGKINCSCSCQFITKPFYFLLIHNQFTKFLWFVQVRNETKRNTTTTMAETFYDHLFAGLPSVFTSSTDNNETLSSLVALDKVRHYVHEQLQKPYGTELSAFTLAWGAHSILMLLPQGLTILNDETGKNITKLEQLASLVVIEAVSCDTKPTKKTNDGLLIVEPNSDSPLLPILVKDTLSILSQMEDNPTHHIDPSGSNSTSSTPFIKDCMLDLLESFLPIIMGKENHQGLLSRN